MNCWRHGEQPGKTCLACAAEKERRERANALLVGLVALLVLLTLILAQWGPTIFSRK
jgi:hypothetical protein